MANESRSFNIIYDITKKHKNIVAMSEGCMLYLNILPSLPK